MIASYLIVPIELAFYRPLVLSQCDPNEEPYNQLLNRMLHYITVVITHIDNRPINLTPEDYRLNMCSCVLGIGWCALNKIAQRVIQKNIKSVVWDDITVILNPELTVIFKDHLAWLRTKMRRQILPCSVSIDNRISLML